ncbi:hypothetical protein HFO68_08075 [Rhizobium laguerreae]|uniref:hypothetical protein n=1 Tax=Rhizobium laguerreae TaxID=1076926 RepID=UPI001C912044|nr:hypothetical protein [Rhizobium laguerreae]MBY3104509.1 hypothetical protein [Rhizobium laguerreae]
MHTLTKLAATLMVVSPIAILATGATAVETNLTTLTATAQCTTDATGGDGVRHGCDSEIQTLQAPDSFVLAQNSLVGGLISGNGSEQECHIEWSQQTEILPGIAQPRRLTLRAHARSPKGHFAGRGWATCKYSVTLAPLAK